MWKSSSRFVKCNPPIKIGYIYIYTERERECYISKNISKELPPKLVCSHVWGGIGNPIVNVNSGRRLWHLFCTLLPWNPSQATASLKKILVSVCLWKCSETSGLQAQAYLLLQRLCCLSHQRARPVWKPKRKIQKDKTKKDKSKNNKTKKEESKKDKTKKEEPKKGKQTADDRHQPGPKLWGANRICRISVSSHCFKSVWHTHMHIIVALVSCQGDFLRFQHYSTAAMEIKPWICCGTLICSPMVAMNTSHSCLTTKPLRWSIGWDSGRPSLHCHALEPQMVKIKLIRWSG